jgi:hypothetical protein
MTIGTRVRFSAIGRAKVGAMPEAWGLHRALYAGEVGEVTDVETAPTAGAGLQVCVEFHSGSAHYWDADCFEPE